MAWVQTERHKGDSQPLAIERNVNWSVFYLFFFFLHLLVASVCLFNKSGTQRRRTPSAMQGVWVLTGLCSFVFICVFLFVCCIFCCSCFCLLLKSCRSQGFQCKEVGCTVGQNLLLGEISIFHVTSSILDAILGICVARNVCYRSKNIFKLV